MACLPSFAAIGSTLTDEHQLMDAYEEDVLTNLDDLVVTLTASQSAAGGATDEATQRVLIAKVKAQTKLMVSAFTDYQTLIVEHLAQEEFNLVGAWLNLSAAEFQRFQDDFAQASGHGSSVLMPYVPKIDATQAAVAATSTAAVFFAATESNVRAAHKSHGSAIADRTLAKPVPPPYPILYDRRGRAVNMQTPGCCFDGVDSCCKQSAYERLLSKWRTEQKK